MLDFAGNPGATTYEIRFAKGAVLAPDGSISGPSETAIIDSATGKIRFWNFDGPGTYTFVARAQSRRLLHGVEPAGQRHADRTVRPAHGQLQRPPRAQLPAARRGPRNRGRGGRVTVAIAKGKNGKRFRTLGPREDQQQGRVQAPVHAAQARLGTASLLYKGSAAVERGTAYAQVRFRRVIF